jgi:hypothetical protein
MSVLGGSAWCEHVTELLRGQRLLDQQGFSVIEIGFDQPSPLWTHASFLDGYLHRWQSGAARSCDLSVLVPADRWLADTGDVAGRMASTTFEVGGDFDTVFSCAVRQRFADLPRLPNAHLDVLFHFTTSPFGSFDLHYRVHEGRIDLVTDPGLGAAEPDLVISLWFGHFLGAMAGERIVLDALERGCVRRGSFQHLMLLAGLIESDAHRKVLAPQRELYAALARHADILGSPLLRAAAVAATHEDTA